jgi:hypothetical protein
MEVKVLGREGKKKKRKNNGGLMIKSGIKELKMLGFERWGGQRAGMKGGSKLPN